MPLLATTHLLRKYDYVCPVPLMHRPKSHPSCDSYPFPGTPLKIPGHAYHGKPVCLHTTKKGSAILCVFKWYPRLTFRNNSNCGRAFKAERHLLH